MEKKRFFFSYHSNGCYKEKKLHQKLESYRFKTAEKIGLTGLVQGEIKSRKLKSINFQEKIVNVEIIIILHFMTALNNFDWLKLNWLNYKGGQAHFENQKCH